VPQRVHSRAPRRVHSRSNDSDQGVSRSASCPTPGPPGSRGHFAVYANKYPAHPCSTRGVGRVVPRPRAKAGRARRRAAREGGLRAKAGRARRRPTRKAAHREGGHPVRAVPA
jgi:hypothetical protein